MEAKLHELKNRLIQINDLDSLPFPRWDLVTEGRRTRLGIRAISFAAKEQRAWDRSTKTGSSTQGCRSSSASSAAISAASRRERSSVPRLMRRASERATKSAISSGATVMEGTAPAASSTFAVKFCATVLVRQ